MSDELLYQSRRRFLRFMGTALALGAGGSLLAACGGGAQPSPTSPPAAKPTEAPKPAATTAVAPTTAAAKPTAAGAAAPAVSKNLGGELKILQWSHFVPEYDTQFFDPFAEEWGQRNNVKVTVDHI